MDGWLVGTLQQTTPLFAIHSKRAPSVSCVYITRYGTTTTTTATNRLWMMMVIIIIIIISHHHHHCQARRLKVSIIIQIDTSQDTLYFPPHLPSTRRDSTVFIDRQGKKNSISFFLLFLNLFRTRS